jgi:hypothetical protein
MFNTGPSQFVLAHPNLSTLNLIGTKKRHNFQWVLPRERERRLPNCSGAADATRPNHALAAGAY